MHFSQGCILFIIFIMRNYTVSIKLPSESRDVNGCRSSTNDRLFLETAVSAFALDNTATMGEKDPWMNSCAVFPDLAMIIELVFNQNMSQNAILLQIF